MKKIISTLLLAGALSTTATYAQDGYFAIEYTMGFSSGETSDFIESASFRGVTLEYRKMVTPNIGVGADGGWTVFYERRAQATYVRGNESLTGIQYRYLNCVPLFAAADYYFAEEGVKPYAGLGVGTLYTNETVEMGVFYIENEAWQFALRPEVGVLLEASPNLDLMVTGRYVVGFETDEQETQQYFSLNVGFVFKIW